MVVVMKPGTKREDIDSLVAKFKEMDLDVGVTNGVGCTILGLLLAFIPARTLKRQ